MLVQLHYGLCIIYNLEKFEHACYLSTLICRILYLHSCLGSMSMLISRKFQSNTLWMDSHISCILYRRSRSVHAIWKMDNSLLASIFYVVQETLDIFYPRLLSVHTATRRTSPLHFTLLLNPRNISPICFCIILMLLGPNAWTKYYITTKFIHFLSHKKVSISLI